MVRGPSLGLKRQNTHESVRECELSLCLNGHMWRLLLRVHERNVMRVYVGVVVQQRGPGIPGEVTHITTNVYSFSYSKESVWQEERLANVSVMCMALRAAKLAYTTKARLFVHPEGRALVWTQRPQPACTVRVSTRRVVTDLEGTDTHWNPQNAFIWGLQEKKNGSSQSSLHAKI